MKTLVAIHLHQRDAAVDERERFAAAAGELSGPETFALVTCHRVEVYAALEDQVDPTAWCASRLGVAVPPGARVARGAAATLHLFRVAAGLDSAVVGERQILNQLRRTHDERRAGGLDPLLSLALSRALRLGRELRATTPLGGVGTSIGSLAVDAVVRELPDAARSTVLLVGAGEVGKLAARALALRVGRVLITNRHAERAADLAERTAGQAVPLAELEPALAEADAVVSAADTRGSVLTAAVLGARLACGPLLLVDVAVPRSVDADARGLPGLRYLCVDDLGTGSETLAEPVLAALRERCQEAAASFGDELRTRDAAETIRALHEHADELRRKQLARALAKLAHLTERDREVVQALALGLTNALLHDPTVALRDAPERQDEARALFRL